MAHYALKSVEGLLAIGLALGAGVAAAAAGPLLPGPARPLRARGDDGVAAFTDGPKQTEVVAAGA